MPDGLSGPNRPNDSARNLVVITGMSGAGRSEAIHTFEDLGYFCIDNLPPTFIANLVQLTHLPGSRIHKVAVVCDVRGGEFFEELWEELQGLTDAGVPFTLLFLEAEDNVLVSRFKETRRRHPLSEEGSLLEGIAEEREALTDIRGHADLVIDTSQLRPQQLRETILERFMQGPRKSTLEITVLSFGFKYGLPIDADIVMDVRFLPNPFYDAALRPLTGLEEAVQSYVMGQEETDRFLKRWFDLLAVLTPGYVKEGKSHLTLALGCTGGCHRSVVLGEETAAYLRKNGFDVNVTHRDIGKDTGHE